MVSQRSEITEGPVESDHLREGVPWNQQQLVRAFDFNSTLRALGRDEEQSVAEAGGGDPRRRIATGDGLNSQAVPLYASDARCFGRGEKMAVLFDEARACFKAKAWLHRKR